MNIETQMIIGAGAFGLISLGLSVLTLLRFRNQQISLEVGAGQIELLEDTLAETRELLEESHRTVTDHSRRIAWLDAKIRQSRFISTATRDSVQKVGKPKSNINEQRSRVLKLARSGEDTRTIAATVGMMPGEVELILNLSNHSNAFA